MDTIIDNRWLSNPRLVAIDEVTRYSFIPVDRHILIEKPLAQLIHDMICTDSATAKGSLSLGINHLEFSNRSQFLFFKKFNLNGSITVLTRTKNDYLIPQGDLIFDSKVTKFFIGNSLKKGYETLFQNWLSELSIDISSLNNYLKGISDQVPYHYRDFNPNPLWMQLNGGGNFILTSKGFLIDGYLFFTYPEVRRFYWGSTGLIRYRHQEKFESIELGLLNGFANYRLNQSYLLEIQSHLMIGINRWKDMNTTEHELYDSLIGDFSISQRFSYHPKDGRALVFGLGISLDLVYVYSQGIQLQPGLMFNLGAKL